MEKLKSNNNYPDPFFISTSSITPPYPLFTFSTAPTTTSLLLAFLWFRKFCQSFCISSQLSFYHSPSLSQTHSLSLSLQYCFWLSCAHPHWKDSMTFSAQWNQQGMRLARGKEVEIKKLSFMTWKSDILHLLIL